MVLWEQPSSLIALPALPPEVCVPSAPSFCTSRSHCPASASFCFVCQTAIGPSGLWWDLSSEKAFASITPGCRRSLCTRTAPSAYSYYRNYTTVSPVWDSGGQGWWLIHYGILRIWYGACNNKIGLISHWVYFLKHCYRFGHWTASDFRASLGVDNMTEDIKTKMKNYSTAPLDSRFPTHSQTRNCRRTTWMSTSVRRQWPLSGGCLHAGKVPACVQVPLPHVLGVGLGWPPGRRHLSWEDVNWLLPTCPLSSILPPGRWRGTWVRPSLRSWNMA